jgi:hypothetical protein
MVVPSGDQSRPLTADLRRAEWREALDEHAYMGHSMTTSAREEMPGLV